MDKLLSPELFISYAREDAQTDLVVGFLRRLSKALGDSYIKRFYIDTKDMKMGEDWWKQASKAIQDCHYMIVIVTDKSMASPQVRKEYKFAHSLGIRLIPVFAAGFKISEAGLLANYQGLSVPQTEVDAEWDKFLDRIRQPYKRIPPPYERPVLKPGIIERTEKRQEVRDVVCMDREDRQHNSVVLWGKSGFGKTTLAAQLTYDPKVEDYFEGGILWIGTFGRSPNVARLLIEAIARLEPNSDFDKVLVDEVATLSKRFVDLYSRG